MRRLFYNNRHSWVLTFAVLLILVPLAALAAPLETNIGVGIVQLAGFLTGLAGTALNFAVDDLIIGMGSKYTDGGYGVVVEATWQLVRDLMNIFFIFGLIYAGIQMILGFNVGQAKRIIGVIIIGALLVNFSLFFSKTVIEVANVISKEIYYGVLVKEVEVGEDNGVVNVGITGQFFATMGILSFYDISSGEFITDFSDTNLQKRDFTFFMVASIFLLIAAFVFAAGAILIIIRFIVLVFLMIFSPVAFGFLAFPQLSKYASQWWSLLFRQAFFAPAFLFLVYISLLTLNSGLDPDAPLAAAVDGNVWAINTVVNFMIAAGLLIGALLLAKSMGALGAKTSVKVGNALRGRAQSYVGRNTVGAGANMLRKRYERLDAISKDKQASRARRITAGIGATALKAPFLGDRGLRASMQDLEKAKFGGSYSHADDVKYATERKKIQSLEGRKLDLEREIKELERANRTKDEAKIKDAEEKLQKTLAGLSLAELENLGAKTLTEYAHLLTNKQMDQLRDSKSDFALTDSEMSGLKDARKKEFVARFKKDQEQFFAGMKPADFAKLPTEMLKDKLEGSDAETKELNERKVVSTTITGTVLKRIQDDDSVSQDDRNVIVTNIHQVEKEHREGKREKGADKTAWDFLHSPYGKNFGTPEVVTPYRQENAQNDSGGKTKVEDSAQGNSTESSAQNYRGHRERMRENSPRRPNRPRN